MTHPRTALIALIVVTVAAVLFVWNTALHGGSLLWLLIISALWIWNVWNFRRQLIRIRDPEFQASQARLKAAIAEVGRDNCIICRRPLPPPDWPRRHYRFPFHDPAHYPDCRFIDG